MKNVKLLSAVALCSLLSITGCKKGSGEKVDETKAQLQVSTFEGGVGDQWLRNAAKLFEEKNKDRTDFEDGRVGVQIHITSDRSSSGDSLKYSDLNKDIYFTENVDYYYLTNNNKFADITDIMTTPNPEDDNKKIVDKIDENLLSFMERDGKYYAVPFYDCFYGLIYDKDLFKQKSFYMTNDGQFTNQESQFGTGPNGVAGDWDDGLPKTYAQFKTMMARMVSMQVIPFTYSNGNATEYPPRALVSWWSDDEGYEQTNLNYNFNGLAKNIVTSFDGSGNPVTEQVQITKDNGYKLRSQKGLYNALYFARDILCSSSDNYRPYSTNYDVQDAFINNKYQGGSTKPIAMMFEGTWWENEAAEAFEYARSMGVEEFNYGLMPIPKSDESKVGEDATFMNLNDSFGFISASSKNMKLAKEFFSYLHTDDSLRAFTIETNMTRGLDYNFNDSDLDKITSYARDLIAIKQSEHTSVVYPYSGLDFFVNNEATFDVQEWVWGTSVYTNNPVAKFIDSPGLTAQTYFNDHRDLLKAAEWAKMVGE